MVDATDKASVRPRREGQAVASSSGIIIGRAQTLLHGRKPIPEHQIDSDKVNAEVTRLLNAIDQARREVDVERQHLIDAGAGDMVIMLDVHRMLIADPELLNRASGRIIEQQINAEWAVRKEMDAIQRTFGQMKDEYLRNRKDDVEQAGRRILRHLQGSETNINHQLEKAKNVSSAMIYVGDDFSVSDIVNMWRHGVAGVIIEQGGVDAHNVIVARGIGLPALVGAAGILSDIEDDDALILDAESDRWILNPCRDEEMAYARSIESFWLAQMELEAYARKPSLSSDGHELKLMANIEFPEELDVAEQIGIDGVGLFRSEFLFLNSDQIPDEDAQFKHYQSIMRRMRGKPVTMRLLDLGGDKPWHFHHDTSDIEGGDNPAMGLRGVRLLMRWPDILKAQLCAMLRAGEEGELHILIPMVTTCDEVIQVRRMAESCRQKLGLKQPLSIGTMIEVPASALIADDLARVSDFFSIGTNDLMQYTLAADRTDDEVASLYQPGHGAIVKLIELAAIAAHRAGIPIAVCGELSARSEWTETFLNLGMDSLSMSLNRLLLIRKQLSGLTYKPIH